MSVVSGIQSANLEFVRQTQFATHSEGEIVFLARGSEQYTLENTSGISTSWAISEYDIAGRRLPPDVLYELQIAESALTAERYAAIIAVKHQSVIYQIVRPSPFPPIGETRIYRFWISPQENDG